MTPESFAGLLSEPNRLRVLGAVALGARTPRAIAEITGMAEREVAVASRRLRDHGLVRNDENGLFVSYELLDRLSCVPDQRGPRDRTPLPLRPFIRGPRLVKLPEQECRRRAVLEHIAARSFTPNARYPERSVNDRLRRWCEGSGTHYSTMRDFLVDMEILARCRGVYWVRSQS